MLTNKIISVLIIITSLFFTSCWKVDIKDTEQIKQINWEWKKGKSTWWEVDFKSVKDTIVYSWSIDFPKWKPKDIK